MEKLKAAYFNTYHVISRAQVNYLVILDNKVVFL